MKLVSENGLEIFDIVDEIHFGGEKSILKSFKMHNLLAKIIKENDNFFIIKVQACTLGVNNLPVEKDIYFLLQSGFVIQFENAKYRFLSIEDFQKEPSFVLLAGNEAINEAKSKKENKPNRPISSELELEKKRSGPIFGNKGKKKK